MPIKSFDHQLGKAVIDLVQTGAYPESEHVVAAELSPSTLPVASRLIQEAVEDVKSRISSLSKKNASDINGWISQAKRLRLDIANSQSLAEELVQDDSENNELRSQVADTASKKRLLESEIIFNESLSTILNEITTLSQAVERVHFEAARHELLGAVASLVEAEHKLDNLQRRPNVRVFEILRTKLNNARQTIVKRLQEAWGSIIYTDSASSTVIIRQNVCIQNPHEQNTSHTISINSVVAALSALGLLQGCVSEFAKFLTDFILLPRLELHENFKIRPLIHDEESFGLSAETSDISMEKLLADLEIAINVLQSCLPASVVSPLSQPVMLTLIPSLLSDWLSREIPEDIDKLQEFAKTRNAVSEFGSMIEAIGWPGKDQLDMWNNGVYHLWVRKREDSCLVAVRRLLRGGFGFIRSVERIETQIISQVDDALIDTASPQDWNAAWSDDEGPFSAQEKSESHTMSVEEVSRDTEEDVSAWGLEEDDETEEKGTTPPNATDQDADAWGWGEDNEEENNPSGPKSPTVASPKRKINGIADSSKKDKQIMTLKETYNVTALPEQILALISHIASDVDLLRKSSSSDIPSVSNVPKLLAIPSLTLAMYRAIAFSQYSLHESGNMFLYNDNTWLADQVRQMVESTRLNSSALEADAMALETFGKRAYAKEMESQRTIIKDYLDGAQGFSNCTIPPFSQECDLAIDSVVERLERLHKEWRDVLSHSALQQSVGSLLSTVIDKIQVDIQDMGDISEPESQRLTAFCKKVIALEHLFTPQTPSTAASINEGALPHTAVYVPGWFKFQYLSEILDSSLVDIKYLWTDGGLQLEFQVDEVVELIEALFADSEHRRRAIAEIRRS